MARSAVCPCALCPTAPKKIRATMVFMDDSMAQPRLGSGVAQPSFSANLALPTWKTAICVTSAVLLAALFVVAGTWKITDPFGAAARIAQAKVPGPLSLPAAVLLGIGETFSAVLLLVPRFRRWGA